MSRYLGHRQCWWRGRRIVAVTLITALYIVRLFKSSLVRPRSAPLTKVNGTVGRTFDCLLCEQASIPNMTLDVFRNSSTCDQGMFHVDLHRDICSFCQLGYHHRGQPLSTASAARKILSNGDTLISSLWGVPRSAMCTTISFRPFEMITSTNRRQSLNIIIMITRSTTSTGRTMSFRYAIAERAI